MFHLLWIHFVVFLFYGTKHACVDSWMRTMLFNTREKVLLLLKILYQNLLHFNSTDILSVRQ